MLELLLRNMLWAAWWPYSTMLLALEKAAQQQQWETPQPKSEPTPTKQPTRGEEPVRRKETSMGSDAFAQPGVPEPLREIMKLSLEQARRGFETFVLISEKAWKSMESGTPLGRTGLFALNSKIVEIARKNAEANFLLAMKLIEAKDLRQALELQAQHAKTQTETFVRQLEEMRDLAMQIIQEANPAARSDVASGKPASAAGNVRSGPGASFASYAPSSSVTPGTPGRSY